MRRMIFKDNFLDLAHQAVGAVRRIIGGSEPWSVRDTLSSKSQLIFTSCKANTVVNTVTLEEWVDDLARELELQSTLSAATTTDTLTAGATSEPSSNIPDEALRPLSESSLIANLEVAQAFLYSCNAEEAIRLYTEKKLVIALVQVYCNVTLTQKLRDCCASAIVEVSSSAQQLLDDFIFVSTKFLRSPLRDYNGRVLQILLASLVVEVLHKLQLRFYNRVKVDVHRETAVHLPSLIDSLFDTVYALTIHKSAAAPRTASSSRTASCEADESLESERPLGTPVSRKDIATATPSSNSTDGYCNEKKDSAPVITAVAEGSCNDSAAASPVNISSHVPVCSANLDTTVCVVFLAVVAGIYRGRSALKEYIVYRCGYEYVEVWVRVASQISQMHTYLFLLSPRSPVSAMLEPLEYWRAELLEGLMELCTTDSFTAHRAMVMASISGAGNNSDGDRSGHESGQLASLPETLRDRQATRAAASISGTVTAAQVGSGLSLCSAGRLHFKPIPADWETYLSSSSSAAWHLASALFPCMVTLEGVEILKAVLLLLDTRHASAEALYRSTISTLTLLCVSNPRNAVILTKHQFLYTITALINCNQPSVFPTSQKVTLHCRHGEGSSTDPKTASTQTLTLTPANTLNVNTTQLTFCLLNTLTSTVFSKGSMELLMQGIKDMCSIPSSQTDVDVIESLLYGLGRAFIPHPLLFFPGDGYVSWRLKQMFPRGSGYSFTAWIYPTSVCTGGSCLYSFMDQNDTRVSLLVVADGRQCAMAVRVNKAGEEPAERILNSGLFVASAWTHVVVNHGVALNVYVNGQRLEGVHDIPYPKEKHSVMFTMGGAAQLPGLLGLVSGMNISATLSEKEIAKLHAAGPVFYDPSRDCASFLEPFFESEGAGNGSEAQTPPAPSSLQQNDMIAKRSAEFRWSRIELYVPTDTEDVLVPSRVAEWVLGVLKGRRTASLQNTAVHTNVAKLSLSFLSTCMQLSTTEQLTQLMHKSYLDRLRAEVLSWKTTFPEFASLLLQSVTPRGGGKVLHRHACTQCIFDILLHCVLRSGAGGNGTPNRVASSVSNGGLRRLVGASGDGIDSSDESAAASTLASLTSSVSNTMAQEANATNIILRELSDCLLVKENTEMFQENSARFQSILNVSLHLPKECIKSVVMLIEKLCRSEEELRRVLLFLFTPSSVSPTADTAKVWVLRMLFDIAQEEITTCEMIQECFKGRGIVLMLLLINGKNHSSEAIRVLALGLLSLLMPLKGCGKFFKKYDGFDILSLALTAPHNDVPLGIRTFDALFRVAFDEFRRHREKRPEADSITTRLMATAHILHRQKQRDPNSSSFSNGGGPSASMTKVGLMPQGRMQRRTADYLGHTPSIIVNQLGTRRGYSFEHTHDYGRVSDDFGEIILLNKGRRYHNLHLPLALKTVLCALDYLIRSLMRRLLSTSTVVNPATAAATSAVTYSSNIVGSSTDHLTTVSEPLASPLQRHESGMPGMSTGLAQMDDERLVIEVLNYLEKVIEWPKHAVKVMDIPWLGGLWAAVCIFFDRPADLSSAAWALMPAPFAVPGTVADTLDVTSAACPLSSGAIHSYDVAVHRLHHDRSEFVAEVTQRTRTIIRKMVILDISMNERAQIRSIRDGEHPPRLVRIVLEEVARHFSAQKNGELLENAGNIIRNLNALLKDVHTALYPFPSTLGVSIIVAITNISVSSSMQVRRRMKNSSSLLTIRDTIAFYVLRESRRFLRLRRRSLNHLIDMNVNNAFSITVLLLHLADSIRENSVNEVEVLVMLIQQLVGADSTRLRELHSLLGDSKDAHFLAELLSSKTGVMSAVQSPLLPRAFPSQATLSDRCLGEPLTDTHISADGAERGAQGSAFSSGGKLWGEEDSDLSPGAYTIQILDWCQTHPETWAAIQRNARTTMASLGMDKLDDKLQQQKQHHMKGHTISSKVFAGTLAGLSERSRREFQLLQGEFESELAKGSAGGR